MDLSVVILTLMRLPESKMTLLKRDFGKGVALEEFIAAVMRHMPSPGPSADGRSNSEAQVDRIETASDLTDFFAQVGAVFRPVVAVLDRR